MNKKLGRQLIEWYKRVKRDLPWRTTKDPYLIWVSEIILQQTRVDQGLPYYLRFIERFQNIRELAYAEEDEVLNYWQGLGYYSRARNMYASSKIICELNNGVFPSTYHELVKLKGIGPYTAAAIASIAFDEPYPVVDGNVNRVVSRLFGIDEAVNSSSGLKMIHEKLNTFFVREDDPGNFNQAIMELGAMICKPTSPDCNNCVLREYCHAFNRDEIERYPIKTKLKTPKQIYLYYFVLRNKNMKRSLVYLNKRKANSIWKNMYDFPGIESVKKQNIDEVITNFKKKYELKEVQKNLLKISGPIKHQLTHRTINAFFIEINVDGHFQHKKHTDLIPVHIDKLTNYPVPKLIENHLKYHILDT